VGCVIVFFSAGLVVDHLKSSGSWDNTVFLMVFDNAIAERRTDRQWSSQALFSEQNLRGSAFISGGYVEKSLKANDVLPYRTNSFVHMSDLHATVLSIAKPKPTQPKSDASLNDKNHLGLYDGIDQWYYLIHGGENSIQDPPRSTILHGKRKYNGQCGDGFIGALRVGDFKLVVFVDSDFRAESTMQQASPSTPSSSHSCFINYRVVNVKQNPTESEGTNCDNPRFDVISELYELWRTLKQDSFVDGDLPTSPVRRHLSDSFVEDDLPLDDDGGGDGGVKLTAEMRTKGIVSHHGRKLSEIDALSAFYISTLGSSWTINTNWLSSSDPCPSGGWHGIYCDGSQIINLYLPSNNLQGSLPSQIGLLTSLTSYLDFSQNTLSGSLPSQIGLLTGMVSYFDVWHNNINGTIPSQLGQLTAMELQFAACHYASFTGAIPSELGQMTALMNIFTVGNNLLTSTIPSELGLLSLLTNRFELKSNTLSGPIPSQLGQLTALTTDLGLYSMALSGPIPSELGLLSLIKSYFYLYGNDLTGPIPSQLGQLTSMTSTLGLYSTKLSGPIPSELGLLSPLKSYFYLYANDLTGPIPSQLGQLTSLTKYLNLYSNSLSGPIPSELGLLSQMSYSFYLYSNELVGPIPSQLGQLTALYKNFVPCAFNNCSGTIPSELGKLTLLTSLINLGDSGLTGLIPSQLGQLTRMSNQFLLDSNSLTGSLPSQLGRLTAMTSNYALYSNLLCDDIPTEVSVLSSQVTSSWGILSGNSLGTRCCISLPTSYNCGPSAAPTLVPTFKCEPGQYINENICADCAAGKFSVNETETECKTCVAGTYSSTEGNSECLECPDGKLSNEERTSCDNCKAGQYSSNDIECVNCTVGQYAPIPLEDDCFTCPSGSFTTSETGAIGCTACSAGQYSLTNVSTTCESCTPGKSQPASGQIECIPCDAGYYSNTIDSTSCLVCGVGYDSLVESTSCDLADEDYFLFANDGPQTCPHGTQCDGGYQTPIPDKGYWVDRTSYDHMTYIHKCQRSTCTKNRYMLSNLSSTEESSSCWIANQSSFVFNYDMNNHKCGSTKLLCLEGAEGPLCGSCKEGYLYSSETNSCKSCNDSRFKTSTYVIMGFIIVLGCTVIVIYFSGQKFQDAKKFLSGFDSGSLKVLWVTYQIIMSCSWNLDVSFPEPFTSMLDFLTVFSLDFLTLECSQYGTTASRYFFKIYCWCCFPIILIIVLALVGLARYFVLPESQSPKAIINQHIWMVLLVSYLVLPTVANKQFQALNCLHLNKENMSFLRDDSSIDCNSSDYLNFRSYLICFIIVYQSIPLMWFILLYQYKDKLDRHNRNHDFELYIRDNNRSLDHLRFLFNDYKVKKWWFEVFEMYRRIIFIGILPLISTVTSKRASFGCYLAIASVVYFREAEPYRHKTCNVIAHMAQVAILVTYFTAISLDLGVMYDFGLSTLGVGIFLVLCNLSLTAIFLFIGYSRFKYHKERKQNIKAKAEKMEWAVGFSAKKFRTTLKSINATSVAASEVLVFYYASFELARMAMRSGLPAFEKFGGVPFTLRHPHQCGITEQNIFACHDSTTTHEEGGDNSSAVSFPNDVLLVLALPRGLLRSLKGYEEHSYLCCLPVGVLKAMRPVHPTRIVDVKPWSEGVVMVPPPCILRSYNLVKEEINKSVQNRLHKIISLQEGDQNLSSSCGQSWCFDKPLPKVEMKDVIQVKSMDDFTDKMKLVRDEALKYHLVPLYHYTMPVVVPLILQGGMRMSTQGQGDGGVYFSLKGPLSYKLGQKEYEKNIIKDCFGVARVDEYLGQGKLDALIIYGCDPNVLLQAPGGRDNAKMVPKSYFTSLMLPEESGDYFLRSDRILAVFEIHSDVQLEPPTRFIGDSEISDEVQSEKQVCVEVDRNSTESSVSVRQMVETVSRLETEEEALDEEEDVEGGGVFRRMTSKITNKFKHSFSNESHSGRRLSSRDRSGSLSSQVEKVDMDEVDNNSNEAAVAAGIWDPLGCLEIEEI